jgi:uncharacterized membrane protein (UPF0127 family)
LLWVKFSASNGVCCFCKVLDSGFNTPVAVCREEGFKCGHSAAWHHTQGYAPRLPRRKAGSWVLNPSLTIKSLWCLCGLWLVLTGGVGCVAQESKSRENKPQKKLAVVEFTIERAADAPVPVLAEIARTEAERETGLMFRKSLADGEGMLFVFEKDQMLSFWMKNTLLPLSIAYIGYNGRILEIHDMKPRDLTPIHSSRSARYALEVPQGWFERVNITTGDVFVIPAQF